MTPKLRLNDEDRNVLLSWILKSCHPGKHWTILSTQMMLAPTIQAIRVRKLVYGTARTSTRILLTYTADTGHYPPTGVIVECHGVYVLPTPNGIEWEQTDSVKTRAISYGCSSWGARRYRVRKEIRMNERAFNKKGLPGWIITYYLY